MKGCSPTGTSLLLFPSHTGIMFQKALYLLLLVCAQSHAITAPQPATDTCPLLRIEAERLPDLNTPRSGHSALMVNGEPTVIGGHTSGFVLTPTLEYLKDGRWHQLPMTYAHDGGFAVALRSGRVLIGGGFKDNLGISQSFEVETYDPASRSFNGFGCLNRKRAAASALELSGDSVLITGNWYTDDGMELYDGRSSFLPIREVKRPRVLPHLFRTSDGDVLVVGGYDNHGQPLDAMWVERMTGGAFRPQLLEEWRPLRYDHTHNSDDSFVGDTALGDFTYLMPVINRRGQVAVASVHDTVFSLLSTDVPVPVAGPWGEIVYYSPVYADRQRQRGFMVGGDPGGRIYALRIDYALQPARLMLFHTDPLADSLALTVPLLTGEGNLILTGLKTHKSNFNFSPSAASWLLPLGDSALSSATSDSGLWRWALLVLAVLTAVTFAFWRRGKTVGKADSADGTETSVPVRGDKALMERISRLMEEEKPYLQPRLRVSDIAAALGTNSRYVSDCIKAETGCSFSQYINSCRLEHAKQLLVRQPSMKISSVAVDSGFSNDKALTRTFKELTGMTPSEWKDKYIGNRPAR